MISYEIDKKDITFKIYMILYNFRIILIFFMWNLYFKKKNIYFSKYNLMENYYGIKKIYGSRMVMFISLFFFYHDTVTRQG